MKLDPKKMESLAKSLWDSLASGVRGKRGVLGIARLSVQPFTMTWKVELEKKVLYEGGDADLAAQTYNDLPEYRL